MTLQEYSDSIKSREECVSLIRALRKDLIDNQESWENKTLDSFLEALAAWMEDMDGYYLSHNIPVPSQPSWQTVGDMLMAAKMYE